MIKMTEIVKMPGQYNPKSQKVDVSYELRDVYVNPKFVVTVKENIGLSAQNKRSALIASKTEGHKISNVSIANGHNTPVIYDFVGAPSSLAEILSAGEQK